MALQLGLVHYFRLSFTKGQAVIADMNTNWDTYLANLKSIGVDEYVKVLQAAFDKFNR